MQLFTIVSFMILTYCNAEKPVDYRLALAAACTPRVCTSPGPLCETCSSLVACVQLENGTYTTNPLGACTAPSYCIDGVCSADFDPFCSGVTELPFKCNQVGVFPDPFYHNKFIFCYKDGSTFKSISNVCDDGFSFNIADDLCSEELSNAECPVAPYPVSLCEEAGQTDSIPDKPAMYYICTERSYNSSKTALYPDLYICLGGEPYVDYKCGGSETNTPATTTLSK